jgi:hypothetical protein
MNSITTWRRNLKPDGPLSLFFAKFFFGSLFWLALPLCIVGADSIHANVKDTLELSEGNPDGESIALLPDDSVLIALTGTTRFIRGIELELTAPQLWLPNQGSLAIGIYSEFKQLLAGGDAIDMQGRRLKIDTIPGKIQTIYQIPLRKNHGLRNTPYVSVLQDVPPISFPVLIKLYPIVKTLAADVENMRFVLNVKPIFSDEGAIRITMRYPDGKQNGPVAVLIDDHIIENPAEETVLQDGDHHLTILSTDYRSENRRFIVERGKTLDLSITLHDLIPLMIFEAPARALIYLDNNLLSGAAITAPFAVEPGIHEVKIQVSDYAILKTINVQKGKTYRVAFTVDMEITEE